MDLSSVQQSIGHAARLDDTHAVIAPTDRAVRSIDLSAGQKMIVSLRWQFIAHVILATTPMDMFLPLYTRLVSMPAASVQLSYCCIPRGPATNGNPTR